MAVDGRAVPVLDAVDQRRRDALAAVGQLGIGGHHAQNGGLRRAERHGQRFLQVVDDAETLGRAGDLVHADLLGQPHGHQVARLLDPQAQRRGAVEAVRIVGRLPLTQFFALIDGDRRVQDDAGRREAILKGGEVDEGLEGGARLAQRLGRPVELALAEAEAAGHGQNAARARIHRDHAARDLGDLHESEAVLGIGLALGVFRDRLYEDQRAAHQHICRIVGGRPHPLVLQPGPRPGHLGEGDRAGGAVLEPDLGRLRAHSRHRGQAPVRQGRGRPLHRLHRGSPIPVLGNVLEDAQRTAPAMAAVIGHEALAQRSLREALQAAVQRGPHREAAAVEVVVAIEIGQFAPHFLDEVVGIGGGGAGGVAHHQVGGLRLTLLLGRDVTVLAHLLNDPVPPLDRRFLAPGRVVVVGRLGQRGEVGRLGDGQFVERLVEIVERGGRNAVGPLPEVNLVQVKLQDAILGEGLLKAERDDGLFDLTGDRHLVGEQEVLSDLLGDGRGAYGTPPLDHVLDVLHRRHGDGRNVHARVLVEGLVLGRQEGVDNPQGYRLDGHGDALFHRELGQQASVACVDARHGRRLVLGELLDLGQVLPEVVEGVERRRHGDDRPGEAQAQEPEEKSSQHGAVENPGGCSRAITIAAQNDRIGAGKPRGMLTWRKSGARPLSAWTAARRSSGQRRRPCP